MAASRERLQRLWREALALSGRWVRVKERTALHPGNRTGIQSKHPRPRPSPSGGTSALALLGFPVVQAVSLGWSKEKMADSNAVPSTVDVESIVERAEQLYNANDPFKLYDYLIQYKDVEHNEIQWRLARVCCDKGKASPDKSLRQACMYEGFEFAKKALKLGEGKCFASHKWYAIMLDKTGEYDGIKHRLSNSYTVKEHFLKAVELNPQDSTSIHSIGFWCFAFADLPWLHRNIAKALFGTPPTSSYEEALSYFQKAEDIDPNFYSMNLMMLGKTHYRLGRKEEAIETLKKVFNFPVRNSDDEQAHKEATEILKKLGVKPPEAAHV